MPGLDDLQLYASFLALTAALVCGGVLVLNRAGAVARRIAKVGLFAAALLAMAAWVRFGDFHTIWVDRPGVDPAAPNRAKIELHQPIHTYEFFHYYIAAKYFRELGYEGLYDCTTLADHEIAAEDHVRPRITGWVRDLDDVLRDKPNDVAIQHCTEAIRPHFSDARWTSYKDDIRSLRRLVGDGFWPDVVGDAGFNPPPSWCLLGSSIANAIPIFWHDQPTYLITTGLDALLLLICAIALARTFGLPMAATTFVFIGASYIASYGWTGGSFLRYSWVTSLILGLCAAKRERWALAGVLLAMSTCDRLFPAAFAVGLVIPLVRRAFYYPQDARRLKRFGAAYGITVAVLGGLGLLVFGLEAWHIFFLRILRHGDVYYGMHIGLKKVITWRDWTPHVNFAGHPGLGVFHDWNLRLRATWASMRWLVIPVQLAAAGLAVCGGLTRKPYESAVLLGIVGMFFFNLPANYYYVIISLVPAVLLVAAMDAPTRSARWRELSLLVAFNIFWAGTLLYPHQPDMKNILVLNHAICVNLLAFLTVWIVGWAAKRA